MANDNHCHRFHPIIFMNGENEIATLVFHWECRKNFSPSGDKGDVIFDGCRNFVKLGDSEVQACICGLCGCHKIHHRRQEVEVIAENAPEYLRLAELTISRDPPPHIYPPPHYVLNRHYLPYPIFLRRVFEMRVEDLPGEEDENAKPRKEITRRTRMTKSQKEVMKAYADKLQWKLLGVDEIQLKQFCDEIGVPTQTFKTWLRNNKSKLANYGVAASTSATCASSSNGTTHDSNNHGDRDGDGNEGSEGGLIGSG